MSIIFAAPTPGQSLTAEPRNALYERPPEVNDPKDALMLHIDKISDPKAIRDMTFFIEKGLTLVALVEGMLRSAVMSGLHTVDMSLIIGPALHEYIGGILDEAGISYDEGFDDDNADDGIAYERDREAALDILKQLRESGDIDDEDMPETDNTERDLPDLMPAAKTEEPTEKPKGLMARI